MNKIAVLTVTAIIMTATGILGTISTSGLTFATTVPDKGGVGGLAPGESTGQEFPPPSTFAPGETGSPPGQIIGPENPGETDESAPGQIIGPESPEGDSPGQIIGPEEPGETDETTPGQEGLESGIIGPE